jgi:hypothetical protein
MSEPLPSTALRTVTRFAPSPNGPLHLGHAWAALVAQGRAAVDQGTFLVRIEDIDGARSRPELADQFRADLAWLGLSWREVAPQSQRIASYLAAAQVLHGEGCSIHAAARKSRRGRTGWGLMVRSIRAPAVHLFRIAARLRRPRTWPGGLIWRGPWNGPPAWIAGVGG